MFKITKIHNQATTVVAFPHPSTIRPIIPPSSPTMSAPPSCMVSLCTTTDGLRKVPVYLQSVVGETRSRLQPNSGLIFDRHRREASRRKKVSVHTATVGVHEQNHHVSTPYPHTTVSTSCPPSPDICPPPVMTFVSLFFFPATHRVVVPAISAIVYYNTVMTMKHSSSKVCVACGKQLKCKVLSRSNKGDHNWCH